MTDGAVDDGVSHGGDHAAEHRGVYQESELHCFAGALGHGGGETLLLLQRQGVSGSDLSRSGPVLDFVRHQELG